MAPYYFIFAKKIKQLGDERTSWMGKMFIVKLAQVGGNRVRSSQLQASDGYATSALYNSLLSQCIWILQSLLGSLNYL